MREKESIFFFKGLSYVLGWLVLIRYDYCKRSGFKVLVGEGEGGKLVFYVFRFGMR